jgi:Transposase DNA-binding
MTKRPEVVGVGGLENKGSAAQSNPDTWVDQEVAGCAFADARLDKRFRALLEQLAEGTGGSIPFACQDWANTKAAYRFLSNQRVNEQDILAGHFEATAARCAASEGPVLVLHDTTEFSFQREDSGAIGMLGKLGQRTVCGILMHSSLAVTSQGLPLGIAAIKFWTRNKFKGTNALKKRINPTRVPIGEKESVRWLENLQQSTALLDAPQRCVHIGDRESDIYELFCAAHQASTHFLIRTCVDRLAGDGTHTIADEIALTPSKGLHAIEFRDSKGELAQALLELRYQRIHVRPPLAKQKHYPDLTLTVLHATERDAPLGRDKIDWKLITDLPIRSRAEAIEKLEWYALRWKIEVFHKILKSGCKAEESKLRTADRLANLIAIFCILSWRIFWLTMINRVAPQAPPSLAFTTLEIGLLDQAINDRGRSPPRHRSLSYYLIRLARLGGYLARAGDPPPGNTFIWRGLSRLTDIALGFTIATRNVGN